MNCSKYASSTPGLFGIKQFKSMIFIILIALSIHSAAYGAIPVSERAALIALYNSTNGDGWTDNSGWKAAPVDADGFAMPGTENTWFGITVTDDSVYDIDLLQNNLTGTIPPELGNLTNLENLSLMSNELTGTIPPELEALQNLTKLALGPNQLTGTIPPELGNLTNLKDLYLFGSELTGTIPAELGNLTNLETLALSSNELTGTIPPELGNLTNLKTLFLSVNELTGTIPPELEALQNLKMLSLDYNQLTGSIPPELGNLANLESLILMGNELSGPIPPEIGNMINLQSLDLTFNNLTGTIPLELCDLLNLRSLRIAYNQLTGPVPEELGTLNNLEVLNLSGNQLTGTISAQLGNLTNLQNLSLYSNELTGTIPAELGNLTNLESLILMSNELTGPIPAELGNLTNLEKLSLSFNKLTGTLPLEIGNLTNLTRLDLAYNELTGPIPSVFGNLINLTALDLYNNQLTGAIPSVLGNLTNLNKLNLSNNRLTGTIPTFIETMLNLEELSLSDNQLTGTIPSELGNLINLTALDLSDNQLTGTIPSELGNLVNLKSLFLHNNQLTGNIPPELDNLTNLELLTVNANRLNNPPNGTVALIIDAMLSAHINSELSQFKTDLNNEGYTVVEKVVSNITPPEVREYLQELYIQTDEELEGAILIGNIPYAYKWYLTPGSNPEEYEVISYQYYSDLDGIFETSAGYVSPGGKDYSFDVHSGNLEWEIWVGVLPYYKDNLTDTVSALKRYFKKNHEYRTCNYTLPEAFLHISEIYTAATVEEHNDLLYELEDGDNAWTPFSNASSARIYFKSPSQGLTVAQGYADLSAGLADFTNIHTHGTPSSNGQIDISWVENNPVKTAFFTTTGCSVGNLDYVDNFLTSILYSPTSMVVVAQGSTYTVPCNMPSNVEGFYGHNIAAALDSGKNFGQSFKTHINVPLFYPFNSIELGFWDYYYAPRIILGDPTLTRLTDCEPPPNNGGESEGGGGGGGSGIFGNISSQELIGYHMDWIGGDGKKVYMPVTNWIKALKGAQTHVEGFAPDLANFIRGCFDKLEERANKNPEGLLFRTGTYILPLLGKFAETYLDIFDSRELMDNAYKKTTINTKKFDKLYKQGEAVSSHKVEKIK